MPVRFLDFAPVSGGTTRRLPGISFAAAAPRLFQKAPLRASLVQDPEKDVSSAHKPRTQGGRRPDASGRALSRGGIRNGSRRAPAPFRTSRPPRSTFPEPDRRPLG